jgi:hypothetical protein
MTDTSKQVGSLYAARQARRGVGAAMAELQAALDGGGELGPLVARLTETWHTHVTVTESDDGLLADVISEAPNLAPRCQSLREEHAAISDALDAAPGDPADLRAILADIDRHRHRGAELVYDAFNTDISTGD